MRITRKGLLRWSGVLGTGWVLPKAVSAAILRPREKMLPRLKSEVFKPGLCKLCPSQCMLRVRVMDGKAVGVEGKPGHPISRGTLCPKGYAVLQELYHPDRLRGPLRRRGPKGSGRWEDVSWGEALLLLRERLSEIRKAGKPRSLAVLAGPVRDLRRDMLERFARSFGTDRFWDRHWTAAQPPLDAFEAMHGTGRGAYYDILKSNQIFAFGWDWLQESGFPVEAQRVFSELRRGENRRRAKLWQIEPRLSTGANKADEWISLKPGGEGVLALGIAHVLVKERLYDADFLKSRTGGFAAFSRLVLENYPPAVVEKASGVSQADIIRLARAMASDRSSLAITNRGSFSQQAAVACLNLLIGGEGVAWGCASSNAGAPAPSPEAIGGLAPALEVLLLDRVNPVFLSAQPAGWTEALGKIPLVVSFSSFLDETAEAADLILPPHGSLEAWQDAAAVTMDGGRVRSFTPPAVNPLYDTGETGDFVLRLARALGGPAAEALPWKDFAQAVAQNAAAGDVVGTLAEGAWSAEAAGTCAKAPRSRIKFPLEMLAGGPARSHASPAALGLYVYIPLVFSFGEGAHLPYLNALAGSHLGDEWETWVELHPETAGRLGVADRQMVFVETAAGRVRVRARFYEGIRRDAVAMPFGMGHAAMGRFAKGIGANPAELAAAAPDGPGGPVCKALKVKVYAA